MDYFVSQLQIPGFDPFRRPAQALPVSGAANDVVFAFSTAGASAIARETNDGFVVLSGSTARRGATETFPAGYRALRDQLLAEGRLVDESAAGLYRFISDAVFASPSAAASIVAGRSASGPLEWKVSGTGQTYRDWAGCHAGMRAVIHRRSRLAENPDLLAIRWCCRPKLAKPCA